MKQAILITAYKNAQQIYDIVDFFGKEFEFYIHIDVKSKLCLPDLAIYENVHIYKEYVVNYASENHLKAILFLSERALTHQDNYYFHLITGQDFPIKSKNYFTQQLNTSKDYIEYRCLPSDMWADGSGGLNRIQHYHFLNIFNLRFKIKIGIGKLHKIMCKIQQILKFKRKHSLLSYYPALYGGSTYWSLKRNSLQFIVDSANDHVIKSIDHTFCVEEIFIQTVLLNSDYKNNVVNDNLRYIDWVSGRGGYPGFLDETDYENLVYTNCLFARKFHENSSEGLKSMLLTLLCE